jgi:hypothetical protein
MPLESSQTLPPVQDAAEHLSTVTHMPVAPSQDWPLLQLTPMHLSAPLQAPVAPSQYMPLPQVTVAHLSVLAGVFEPQPDATPRSNAIVENMSVFMVRSP